MNARIVDVNAAAERITGHPRAALIGRFVGRVVARQYVESHLVRWRELVDGRQDRYEMPATLSHADGHPIPIRLTMTVIRDDTGRPVRGVGMARLPDRPVVPAARRPTSAEAAVLSRLAAGHGIRRIADDLALTRRGVDYRIAQLRRKLRAEGAGGAPATTGALVARAYTLGILAPSTWPPLVDPDLLHGG